MVESIVVAGSGHTMLQCTAEHTHAYLQGAALRAHSKQLQQHCEAMHYGMRVVVAGCK
jgi:hypothetical protein